MFRSRFLLTAVVAVAAALAVPATSQATFALKIDVYNVTVDGSGNFTQGSQVGSSIIIADEGVVGTSTQFGASTTLENSSSSGETNLLDFGKTLIGANAATGLRFDITTNSNSPGGPVSSLWETVTRTTNNTSSNYRLVVTLSDDGFQTVGGTTTGNFFLMTTADVNQGGISSGSKASVVSSVQYDTTQSVSTTPLMFVGPISPDQTQVAGPVTFTRTTTADMNISAVLTFDVLAGGSAEMSARTIVAAPAPAGLVMFASALPFAGLLRLRRRFTKAEVATAA